eukprot:Gregarina_sp_Pseudo_9__993@NODE_163_length_3904_cov_44_414230_g150_i0_p2_GENE_NODE_163_length_3904_cov_44_414230_g150_i0NODE_163_length_3904_cov_44_414230_g150_i0_p2_ORF_typecomplete_len342_score79_46Acetyltransf_10/PF13673_7/0_00043Acetyltransf_1/PF00583_25/0_00067Acetyltransf_7/PF13508_7/8_2e03Acetyltransf_7/PF13508_7/0_073RNA_pol_Rpo13/PF12136_8/2_7_NODE_163_length_3904_cov_44_414230_g150_i025933618
MGKHEFVHIREARLSDCDQIDEITYRGFMQGMRDRRTQQRTSGYVCTVKGSALMRQQEAVTFVAVRVQESRRDRLRKFWRPDRSARKHSVPRNSHTVFRRRPARDFEDNATGSEHPKTSASLKSSHRVIKGKAGLVSSAGEAVQGEDCGEEDVECGDGFDLVGPHDKQEIVGCVTYATHASEWALISDNEDEAEVRMLAVTSKSDTAARDLIEHALFVARRHGKARLSTLVPPNAPNAVVTFYRNLGFKRCEWKDIRDPNTNKLLCAYSHEIQRSFSDHEPEFEEEPEEEEEEEDFPHLPLSLKYKGSIATTLASSGCLQAQCIDSSTEQCFRAIDCHHHN